MPEPVHQKSFVLTVAESKRLIARGVKVHPAVTAALAGGIVAVAKGTTNGYVVEELTGQPIHKPDYCMGVTRPAQGGDAGTTSDKLPDLVLRKGERVQGMAAVRMVAEMGPGDVFIKGANAINYDKRQAALLIGHPTGGTIGATIGTLTARRATLLLPVGLEKNIPGDLHDLQRQLVAAGASGSGPMLWAVDGEILTEIEAVQILSGARAALIGAGGIGGAEGSVRLSVWGSADEVARATAAIEGVIGEPPFLAPRK